MKTSRFKRRFPPELTAWERQALRLLVVEQGLNCRQMVNRFWPDQRLSHTAPGRMAVRMYKLKTAGLVRICYHPEICWYLTAIGHDVARISAYKRAPIYHK